MKPYNVQSAPPSLPRSVPSINGQNPYAASFATSHAPAAQSAFQSAQRALTHKVLPGPSWAWALAGCLAVAGVSYLVMPPGEHVPKHKAHASAEGAVVASAEPPAAAPSGAAPSGTTANAPAPSADATGAGAPATGNAAPSGTEASAAHGESTGPSDPPSGEAAAAKEDEAAAATPPRRSSKKARAKRAGQKRTKRAE